MKVRSFLFGSAAVAMLCIGAVGCNDNTVTSTNGPAAVTNLQAVSLGAASVGLKWNASTGATSYHLSWKGLTNLDTGSITVQDTFRLQSGLQAGQAYSFTVVASNTDGNSAGSSVTWAPATRYTSDQLQSTTIRIYEKTAPTPLGSGLIVDPLLGGPANISVANPPDPSKVQMVITATNDSLSIGPAYAFDEYKSVNGFYRDLYISRTTFVASSLDTWYATNSIDQEILTSGGNTSAYTLAINQPSGMGQGFYVRTGTSSADYHYARIFVKNNGGSLLQGTSPSRYVELEISYQPTPNLPYAKVAPSMISPRGVSARRLY